jgi:hypothetical protein
MNNNIKELLLKVSPMVGDDDNRMSLPSLYTEQQIEEFAILIINTCVDVAQPHLLDVGDQSAGMNKAMKRIKQYFGVK